LKLGSLKRGRDGSLIVVSRDLTRAVTAQSIAFVHPATAV